MTNTSQVDAIFAALISALKTHPLVRIPLNEEGTRYIYGIYTSFRLPKDEAQLIWDNNGSERLEKLANEYNLDIIHQKDGAVDLVIRQS